MRGTFARRRGLRWDPKFDPDPGGGEGWRGALSPSMVYKARRDSAAEETGSGRCQANGIYAKSGLRRRRADYSGRATGEQTSGEERGGSQLAARDKEEYKYMTVEYYFFTRRLRFVVILTQRNGSICENQYLSTIVFLIEIIGSRLM